MSRTAKFTAATMAVLILAYFVAFSGPVASWQSSAELMVRGLFNSTPAGNGTEIESTDATPDSGAAVDVVNGGGSSGGEEEPMMKSDVPGCQNGTGRLGPLALFPCKITDYRHPFGTCNSSETRLRPSINDTVWAADNVTLLWPKFPDKRLMFDTQHERCHYAMARMLAIFAAVMGQLGLKNWFITHGTLLGAYRHGGFIPWDVDIDIVMPRSHITLVRKLWRKFFPRDMFLQSEKTESTFHMWTGKERAMRVKDRYSTFAGHRFSIMKRGKKFKMRKWHLGAQIDIIPLEKFKGRVKILHHIIDPRLVYPLGEVCFENIMLPAPANVTGFLHFLYGDGYEQMPPNAMFQGPGSLPCLATHPSVGSAWSLQWDADHPEGKDPVQFPRDDPSGSIYEDYKVPYTIYDKQGRAKRK